MIQIHKAFFIPSMFLFAACGGSEHNANSAADASSTGGYPDSPVTATEKGGPGTLSPATESTTPSDPGIGTDTGTGSPGSTGAAGNTGAAGSAGAAGSKGMPPGTGPGTSAPSSTGS